MQLDLVELIKYWRIGWILRHERYSNGKMFNTTMAVLPQHIKVNASIPKATHVSHQGKEKI